MTLPDDGITRPFWTDTKDVFEAAQAFRRAGLCIIPLRGKHPGLAEWKQYQKTRPSEEKIKEWQSKNLLSNIGVVCGAVSDNLIVLDFDGPGGYPAFAATFPQLAETFTVATGGGLGKHIYLRTDQLPPTTKAMQTPIGNLELRSEGTYVVAPGSTHPQTHQPYRVEKPLAILRVADVDAVVAWLRAFMPTRPTSSWQPPRETVGAETGINPTVIEAIAQEFHNRGAKQQKEWLNCSCVYPERHQHGDRNASFGFNTISGFGYCYRCGTILAKDICDRLGIDPRDYGGLMTSPEPLPVRLQPAAPVSPPPMPPNAGLPALSELDLPRWLHEYVSWASWVGNQTPEIFHLGMGIWMAAIAIARRVYADARWGVRVFPNLYMMFVADTTFYRKTTAYKLGEQILTAAIPQMLMPTPGSPERFQDAMVGHAPSNFSQLPQDHQKIVLEAQKFAAQRGLFKDEIAGLFGAFKRDYMVGV